MNEHVPFGQCPRCHSDQTMSIRIMVEQGSTSGVGVGLSRGGVGVGTYGSTTAMAAKYAVGTEPSAVLPIMFLILSGTYSLFVLMAIIGASLGSDGDQRFVAIFLGGLVFLLPGISIAIFCVTRIRGMAEVRLKWAERKRLLDNGWVCLRCGHDWVPRP